MKVKIINNMYRNKYLPYEIGKVYDLPDSVAESLIGHKIAKKESKIERKTKELKDKLTK